MPPDASRCVRKTKDEGDRLAGREERLEEGAVKPESRARLERGRRSKIIDNIELLYNMANIYYYIDEQG